MNQMIQLASGSYETTTMSLGALALLLLVQVFIADIVGIRSRHVPGTPVNARHDDPLFRASRVVGNTNESIAIFIVLFIFCLLSGADPDYTGYLAWAYVVSRAAYAACYYANQQIARSVVFGVSLLSLVGLLITGLVT